MPTHDRIKRAILRALAQTDGPAGAARIERKLSFLGLSLRPRTIRFHLLQMDREGLTRRVSRRDGRELTERGREELAHADVLQKVGFVAARVDELGYRMTFDARTGDGSLIVNVSLVKERSLRKCLSAMGPVFARGLGMGMKLAVVRAQETIGEVTVPPAHVAIATVCSVTLNGILLHEGIPVTSRFGGLVEIRGGQPVRFVEMIEYRGTTIDPLEIFILAGRTRVAECARTGNGIVGASLREIPAVAADDVTRIHRGMQAHGLSGILLMSKPNQPILDIPVSEGRAGVIVVGGLNPVAAIRERGVDVTIRSLAGLADVRGFSGFQEVCGAA